MGPKTPADNNFEAGFSAKLMLKDLTLALDAISSTNTPSLFGKGAEKYLEKWLKKRKSS